MDNSTALLYGYARDQVVLVFRWTIYLMVATLLVYFTAIQQYVRLERALQENMEEQVLSAAKAPPLHILISSFTTSANNALSRVNQTATEIHTALTKLDSDILLLQEYSKLRTSASTEMPSLAPLKLSKSQIVSLKKSKGSNLSLIKLLRRNIQDSILQPAFERLRNDWTSNILPTNKLVAKNLHLAMANVQQNGPPAFNSPVHFKLIRERVQDITTRVESFSLAPPAENWWLNESISTKKTWEIEHSSEDLLKDRLSGNWARELRDANKDMRNKGTVWEKFISKKKEDIAAKGEILKEEQGKIKLDAIKNNFQGASPDVRRFILLFPHFLSLLLGLLSLWSAKCTSDLVSILDMNNIKKRDDKVVRWTYKEIIAPFIFEPQTRNHLRFDIILRTAVFLIWIGFPALEISQGFNSGFGFWISIFFLGVVPFCSAQIWRWNSLSRGIKAGR